MNDVCKYKVYKKLVKPISLHAHGEPVSDGHVTALGSSFIQFGSSGGSLNFMTYHSSSSKESMFVV